VLKPNGGRILREGSDITDLPVNSALPAACRAPFRSPLTRSNTLETMALAESERLGAAADWGAGWARADDVNAEDRR